MQLAAGAVGLCCQKVGEAQILVEGGIGDILVTNEIVAPRALARLADLARFAKIRTVADNAQGIDWIADAAHAAGGEGGGFLRQEVTADDIAAVVARWTGIPVEKMLEGELARLTGMEERLHARVVGQEAAVEAVANAVRDMWQKTNDDFGGDQDFTNIIRVVEQSMGVEVKGKA
jgi:hypothetical protein